MRKFVQGPDGTLYVLYMKAIARVDTATHRVEPFVEPPVAAQYGGDVLDGRLYFAQASHLYSFPLPTR